MPYNRLEHAGNAIQTTLAADIGASDTTCQLTDATGWPTGNVGPFYIVFDPGQVGEEKALVTSRSGNSLLSILRGADGTTATLHASGAGVQHIFPAQEADEANQAVVATLGAVQAKGDLLSGSGANTLARTPAGTNGFVLQADSSAGGGVRWATVGTGQLADNAVTTPKLPDQAVTAAKIADATITSTQIATGGVRDLNLAANSVTNSKIVNGAVSFPKLDSSVWEYGPLSGTTDGSGVLVVTHGASFTPTAVFVTPSSPNGGGGIFWTGALVTAISSTTFTLRCLRESGVTLTNTALTGYFLCLP